MITNTTATESQLIASGYSPLIDNTFLEGVLIQQYNVQTPAIANDYIFYHLTIDGYTDLYCLPIELASETNPTYTEVGVMGW